MPQKIARENDDELMDLGGPHFQTSPIMLFTRDSPIMFPRCSLLRFPDVSRTSRSGQLALIITSHVVKPIVNQSQIVPEIGKLTIIPEV
jgi:hypothetical protein